MTTPKSEHILYEYGSIIAVYLAWTGRSRNALMYIFISCRIFTPCNGICGPFRCVGPADRLARDRRAVSVLSCLCICDGGIVATS